MKSEIVATSDRVVSNYQLIVNYRDHCSAQAVCIGPSFVKYPLRIATTSMTSERPPRVRGHPNLGLANSLIVTCYY